MEKITWFGLFTVKHWIKFIGEYYMVKINQNKDGKGGNINFTAENLRIASLEVGDEVDRISGNEQIIIKKVKK